MIGLFGQATNRLCNKLEDAASKGEVVEMESVFSKLTLDIIGKAVFNYDFDSLSNDAGIVEVCSSSFSGYSSFYKQLQVNFVFLSLTENRQFILF